MQSHLLVAPAQKINLFTQYYHDKSGAVRQSELDFCLRVNVLHAPIDTVYIIKEKAVELPSDLVGEQRIVIIEYEGRPTFRQMFEWMAKFSGPDDINILSNSDICFDSSITKTLRLRNTEALSISRWDLIQPLSLVSPVKLSRACVPYCKCDSFDVWIVRGPPSPDMFPVSEFHLGVPGCDNLIVHVLRKYGKYLVYNPCRDIRCHHIHISGVRHYTIEKRLTGQYDHVHPCRWE